MLGRWGVSGILGTFFVGDLSFRGFTSGLPGGVVNCGFLEFFFGSLSEGELMVVSILPAPWTESESETY